MNNTHITLTFSEYINSDSVRKFLNKLEKTNTKYPKCTNLTIYMSSPGGDVDIAIELFNLIKTLDCCVRIVNTSFVNSAAIIVLLAGYERVCLPGSSFYVHSITKKLNGVYDAISLIREVQEMSANTDKIARLLELSTKKNKSYWKRLMCKGHIITSEKALELGLVHSVEDYSKRTLEVLNSVD